MSRSRKIRWVKAAFTEGEFRGPFWAADPLGVFLMIVPQGDAFEVWGAELVLETKPTLAEAKAFAAGWLPGYLAQRKAA